ncbi:MAG: hypothetical protein SVX43_10675 [Cyanobacteriota bacterium]|nr:hypothetical protein [Cyanobacteriota bacterium]
MFHEIVAAETVEVPMENRQTVEEDSNNAVEVDGVRLEILVPERTWVIPENKPSSETPVQLGFRLTNLRQEAIRFSLINPLLVIIDSDGKRLRVSGGRDILLRSPLVCRLLSPGESLTFFPDIQLSWNENKLYLAGLDGVGGGWLYEGLEAKKYKIKWIYDSNIVLGLCRDIENIKPETSRREIQRKFWLNFIQTPWIEINLAQP